jgi:uncharacterized RDD family membrane protein YckC
MENIHIYTSQNIGLEYRPASSGERMLATILDYFFFGGYFIIVGIVMSFAHWGNTGWALAFLPILFYDIVCEMVFDGQNVGKKIMGLKVVSVDGSQPSFSSFFIRWVFRIADTVATVGCLAFIFTVVNGKGQRLGDYVARTMVVKKAKQPTLDSLLLPKLPYNYEPKYPQAINLTEADYNILKEILNFRKRNGSTMPVVEAIHKAKTKFQDKLNVKAQGDATRFLIDLHNDFVYYNHNKQKL